MNLKTSPLIRYAGEAKRPTPWWLGGIVATFLVILGPMIVVMMIYPVVILAISGKPLELGSVLGQVQEIFTNAAALGVLVLWVVFKEKRPFSSVGLRGTRVVSRFLLGVLGGAVLFLIPVAILVASGQYHVVDAGTRTSGLSALLPVALLLAVWIVQATTEEIVFRGYLLQIHGQQLPAWLAIAITSVGFALIHFSFRPLPLINISLVAAFFSFVALRHGSLWMVAGLHTGWNYVQGNILGIPVSGGSRQTSLLFMGPAQGAPDWLTGGAFGIEGGAAATVVLVVVTAWSYLAFRKHQHVASVG
jgi:uncharacterized protein